jgi:tetratricopeptide (TPR) repeat protein
MEMIPNQPIDLVCQQPCSAWMLIKLVAALVLIGAMIIQSNPARAEDDADTTPLFDELWDYGDPVATRALFDALRPKAEGGTDRSYYLQLLTQIARTHSLAAEFDRAHALLDTVEHQLTDDLQLVRVRYLLERGRTLRSAGQAAEAKPLFVEAYELSQLPAADFYTIDAAHMVALAADSTAERRRWSFIGVDVAEKTNNKRSKRWLGSLYNNMGWDFHDTGEYTEALDMFEKALTVRRQQNQSTETRIAQWCVARCLRSLGRHDEALTIQQELLVHYDSTGGNDGYVYEELGELYLLRNDTAQSREYFGRAYRELSQDTWLVENESDRIQRLGQLGGVDSLPPR